MKKIKKTILIDLDGVLNTYTGNYKHDYIPPIKDGAKDFLEKLSKDYVVKIFTTRSEELTLEWLKKNSLNLFVSGITNIKEPCWLYIDDRCIKFNGKFEDLSEEISNFKPWFKNE